MHLLSKFHAPAIKFGQHVADVRRTWPSFSHCGPDLVNLAEVLARAGRGMETSVERPMVLFETGYDAPNPIRLQTISAQLLTALVYNVPQRPSHGPGPRFSFYHIGKRARPAETTAPHLRLRHSRRVPVSTG